MQKFKPSDFNQKISFCSTENVQDDNGNYSEELVPVISLWCMPHNRSLNQQYQIMDTALSDTVMVVVRHNPKINDTYVVKYQGNQYEVVSISSDESNQILTYDYITLRKVKKAGSN